LFKAVLGHPLYRGMVVAVVAFSGAALLAAQKSADQVVVDKQTLQTLLQRVDQLEARVRQLEAERQPSSDSSGLQPAAAAPAPLAGMDGSSAQASSAPPASPAADPDARAAALQQAAAQSSGSTASSDPEQNPSDNAMMERMDVSR